MKKRINILELTDDEHSLIINALNELRTKLKQEEMDTEFVEDLLIKILDPIVKIKKFGRYVEERDRWWIKVIIHLFIFLDL